MTPAFLGALAIAALGSGIASAAADNPSQTQKEAGDHLVIGTNDMKWHPAPPGLPPGAEITILRGDPTASSGDFALRLRVPAGYHVAPHTHPTGENLTLISGSMLYGEGDQEDKSKAKEITAGTYVYLPAGHSHHVWAGQEGFVLEIQAPSPFGITYAKSSDDPRSSEAKAK